ncbi:Transcriptional activator RfaH [Smithella sp. ME-1]|uniref:Transcriptional activator rfah n=1 Tax=hydrocarbon metagenome TaxID=938273 RepID=A0A0W8FSK4_9ZZZZ|nr:Transcriptional activator RfaH [Smithella sp. ME-1]
MPWYVVHTRSRHEYKVNTRLIQKNLTTFLPEIESWSKQKDRRKKILLPLFPGYVFTEVNVLDNETKLSILKTAGVVSILGKKENSEAIPVSDKKIDAIRRFINTETELFTIQFPREGEPARIIDGPFAGIEGIVLKSNVKKELFVVSIELLQRSVAIQIKGFQISKI